MISEPIYDSVEDARARKVSRSVSSKIAKVTGFKTYSRKVKLSKAANKVAEEKALQTLEQLAEQIEDSF